MGFCNSFSVQGLFTYRGQTKIVFLGLGDYTDKSTTRRKN